jgi:hypothetical protein
MEFNLFWFVFLFCGVLLICFADYCYVMIKVIKHKKQLADYHEFQISKFSLQCHFGLLMIFNSLAFLPSALAVSTMLYKW